MERNNVRDAVTIEHYWKETIMLDVPSAFDNLRRSDDLASAQAYARLAGVLLLLSIVAGGFGEVYVPARLIVPADATATADNIAALGWLFRLGFAVYLVEAVCDVALVLLFYALLRPVDKYLALLAALFGLMATAVFGTSELFYFAASLVLRGDKYLGAFAPEQLRALALLSFKVYGYGAQIFMVFYGVAAGLRGWLILRSGYLPRFLGWILALAGLGFVAQNFAVVLAPAYASNALVLPMLLAGLSLAGWLLAKGVDPSGWEAKAAARCSPASQPSS